MTVLDPAPPQWSKTSERLPPGLVPSAAFSGVITYRMLDYYTRAGYLQANGEVGTGQNRLWAETEVGIARCLQRLIAAGVSPDVAATIARDGPGRHPLRRDAVLDCPPSLWDAP